ncbi:hypothetical protein JMN32_10700 [Fulvivirga sp. 29W222]|uniref:Uncharacterized protein n=1 Tax=Fulvivirga marina TaxID=2494733 RepID=A0A937FYD2_9BACT|nr:hypothetical protein [Fulvivirga marina]MBL6446783.1 hypothetical protein [Fulvivirga marina]
MRKLFLFAILCLPGYFGIAQVFPSEVWHDGKLVLLEGDTLVGQVKYSLETDLVQYTRGGQTVKTFTARKLLFFEIFDKTSNRYRQFYAIPYSVKSNYKAPVIFEVLYTGEHLSLLSRESIEYQVANYPYSMAGTYTRLELVYTHYFLKPDGSISQSTGKKKDLLWVMNKKSSEIKRYIKNNKIRIDRRADLVKLVAYYNALFGE